MRLLIKNLGTIKKAEIDLRPFTVIIGPNNSSKTYVAYSIYGLLRQFRASDIQRYFNDKSAQTLQNGGLSVPISQSLVSETLADFCYSFRGQLDVFFQNTSPKLFSGTHFELAMLPSEFMALIQLRLDQNRTINLVGIEHDISVADGQLRIERADRDNPTQAAGSEVSTIPDIPRRVLFSILLKEVFFGYCAGLTLFPAERNAFIISYKMLSNRRYRQLRDSRRELFLGEAQLKVMGRKMELFRETGDIRYPQPIEDFLDFLFELELDIDVGRTVEEQKVFVRLAEDIESKIQRSNQINFKKTKLGGKEIKVKIRKGLEIDLYNASSSIKQLTPILLYLRHRARKNDVIIIDEPEMNLHPESQARFLEVLAMMVNAGIRIIVTTHSPYILSHLNNLVAGSVGDSEVLTRQAECLYLTDPRAFLRMDDVSAYEVRNDTLVSLKDPDHGIRWDTLSDVSSDIQRKYFEISERASHVEGEEV